MSTQGVELSTVKITSEIRGILPATFEFFGVTKDITGNYIFPFCSYDDKQLAYKIKYIDPNAKPEYLAVHLIPKGFQQSGLFGASLFPTGSRYLTITEGELDALSAFQIQGSKYPTVSLKNGVNSVLTDDDKKFLDKFENIVLCFDSDDKGRAAAKKFASSFPKNKVKIVTLAKGKDANEYLQGNLYDEFINEWWKAKEYTPEGLVQGNATWDILESEVNRKGIPWPWQGIQHKLYDIQTSRIYLLTSGSGVGKSEVVKEIALHIAHHDSESRIGGLFLEESIRETVKILTGMQLSLNLRIPDNVVSQENKRKAWGDLFDNDRWVFWDHFGSNDIESVCNQVRFIANNFGAKYIFLDHISIVVSAQDNGDERKALDEIMTKLRMITQELDIALFLVSHLRRPDGRPHEEGGVTSLAQLRGSAAIGQLADVVIGLERNGQADNESERNITTLRLLKNRITGETGPCAYLRWARDTGRLSELEDFNAVQELIESTKGLNSKPIVNLKSDEKL